MNSLSSIQFPLSVPMDEARILAAHLRQEVVVERSTLRHAGWAMIGWCLRSGAYRLPSTAGHPGELEVMERLVTPGSTPLPGDLEVVHKVARDALDLPDLESQPDPTPEPMPNETQAA
jgi:hypothetical protein